MGHLVLLGDSIFDNARYVPGGSSVIEHLHRCLPADWRATLLAVDGHIVELVEWQLEKLPSDATHLVVSVGGNDALDEVGILGQPAGTLAEAIVRLHEAYGRFRESYRKMLRVLSNVGKPTVICTIYDSIPNLGAGELGALAGFNEVILREAFMAGLPVIDLRLVCTQSSDYSLVSPIEPSASGGAKIARAVTAATTTHDFGSGRSVIYV